MSKSPCDLVPSANTWRQPRGALRRGRIIANNALLDCNGVLDVDVAGAVKLFHGEYSRPHRSLKWLNVKLEAGRKSSDGLVVRSARRLRRE